MGSMRKHYFKVFWRTLLFKPTDRVMLRHSALLAIFGKLPVVIRTPARIVGYETYIGDEGKEKTEPIIKSLIDITIY